MDSYLVFMAGPARANTLRAVAQDLRVFFGVVDNVPAEVVAADVFDFVAHQRGDRMVVRISQNLPKRSFWRDDEVEREVPIGGAPSDLSSV